MLLKLYKDFDEKAEELVLLSFYTIQIHFITDRPASPAGTAALTSVSSMIGLKISKIMGREIPWNMQVRLGDIFVEAFYNEGFIDIYYPKIRDKSYIISATNKWLELASIPEVMQRMSITSTSSSPSKDVIIKGCDRKHTIDLPWTRAIKKLQAIGWRINKKVYKAIKNKKSEIILYDSPFEKEDGRTDNSTIAESEEKRLISKHIEWEFILTKAKALYDYDVFYQKIQADYRGRIYYEESFLGFQGCDIARGLMQFSRKKPMTKEGLWWLAVHTACCYNQSYQKDEIPEWCEADYASHLEAEGLESISVDKFTLNDRVRWTNESMDTIIKAGDTGHLFLEAEKPVSFLAACIEWHEIDTAAIANTIHFTHLPVSIDGSNNGWQHLGAMSKDRRTGDLVGLTQQEIQADFYVQTAKELYRISDGRLKELLDIMPMRDIRKGISKRGSMTRAYSAGAGKIGENMWFDCRKKYSKEYGIEEKDCHGLAKLLIKAIDEVCTGPLDTMAYLQALASFKIGKYSRFKNGEVADKEFSILKKNIKELYVKKDKTDEELQLLSDLMKEVEQYETRKIYGLGDSDIRWTTPSGFNVIYKNYIKKSVRCRGTIAGLKSGKNKTINHVAKIQGKTPDVRGFMCGISPNFVHSMDAAHMALIIDQWNNDFGAIHDSFATHACDVDDLLEITKRTFVEMYDVDNFFDYIRKEITDNKDDVEQPKLGSLDIQEVYYSDYFFA